MFRCILAVGMLAMLSALASGQALTGLHLVEYELSHKKWGKVRFCVTSTDINKRKPLLLYLDGSGATPLFRFRVDTLQGMGFDVTIQAEDGADFMSQAGKCPCLPKVCVLDIDTPSIEQYTTARQIKEKYPIMKIMAYALFERDYHEVEQYGIDVFLKKNCSFDELKAHVRHLMKYDDG